MKTCKFSKAAVLAVALTTSAALAGVTYSPAPAPAASGPNGAGGASANGGHSGTASGSAPSGGQAPNGGHSATGGGTASGGKASTPTAWGTGSTAGSVHGNGGFGPGPTNSASGSFGP